MKNILIVDDHPLIRLAIENMLTHILPPSTQHSASTFQQALDALHKQGMDMILLDLSIPGGLGLDMIARLRSLQADVRILIYSGRDEMSNAPVYLASGANGYLHKNAPASEFESAVDLVLNNKKYIRKEVQQRIVDSFVGNSAILSNPIELLTPREKEILSQLIIGKWTKQIAHEMQLKVSTVSTHKARILEKIQVKNVIELMKKIAPFQSEI